MSFKSVFWIIERKFLFIVIIKITDVDRTFCLSFWNIFSFDRIFYIKIFASFLVFAGWWSSRFKYLTEHNFNHLLLALFWICFIIFYLFHNCTLDWFKYTINICVDWFIYTINIASKCFCVCAQTKIVIFCFIFYYFLNIKTRFITNLKPLNSFNKCFRLSLTVDSILLVAVLD